MSNEQAKQVLQQGIAAARAGQNAEARQLLQEAVKRDPRSESAWLWLSSVAKDDKERIFCLKQLLAINPENENAIKGLRQLGIGGEPERSSGPASASMPDRSQSQSPSQSQAQPPQVGVPLVDEQRLNASMSKLDPILASYKPLPAKELPFQWMKKRRGRIGDSSAMLLRAGVVGVAALVIIGVLAGGAFLVSKIGLGGVAAVFASPTPVPTATLTPTPTAGFTDTPSPTPRATAVPSATPGEKIPKGDISNQEPTVIYPPEAASNPVKDALALDSIHKYDEAIAKLEGERKGLENVKGKAYDAIIYFMVQVYIDAGQVNKAIELLNQNKSNSPFYLAALAYIQYVQKDYDNALSTATQALNADKNLVLAELIAARVAVAKQKYPDALRILNLGLESQPANVPLLLERSATYLAASNLRDAEADALLALWIDPVNENGYILRCRILLTQAAGVQDHDARIQAYGKAVLAAKDFLLYYPSETASWLMLGQARQGEENFAEALHAYSQAIAADKTSPYAQQVFLARGKMYLAQRDYDAALADFNSAIKIGDSPDPQSVHLHTALAQNDYRSTSADVSALLTTNQTTV